MLLCYSCLTTVHVHSYRYEYKPHICRAVQSIVQRQFYNDTNLTLLTNILIDKITFDEALIAAKHFKTGKSCGADGVLPEVLRSPKILLVLFQIINLESTTTVMVHATVEPVLLYSSEFWSLTGAQYQLLIGT
ncbi:Hypothetical predicted protein [Octopus vulgaris]|uniref:Uncharacterized protein n=1 Tax=Octopus vulgaris TaxID=6645 RepID=A0AA36ANC7_OCTVU|nr:Hypothetical predicted protein [Octopus vulgaris]